MTNNKLNEIIGSMWISRDRPEKIAAGQIWTLFKGNSSRGTMFFVFQTSLDSAISYPLHHHSDYRRGIDIVFKLEHMDFNDKLILMIDSRQDVSFESFNNARFIGNVNKLGFELLFIGLERYQKIESALSKLQYLQGLGTATEDDEDKAFESGILDLIPSKATHEEFNQFKNDLISFYSNEAAQLTERSDLTVFDVMRKNYLNFIKLPATEITSVMKKEYDLKQRSLLCKIMIEMCECINDSSEDYLNLKIAFKILESIKPYSCNDQGYITLYNNLRTLLGEEVEIGANSEEQIEQIQEFIRGDSKISNAIVDNLLHRDGIKNFRKSFLVENRK